MMLLAADVIGRLVVPNSELEAGVVAAFIGAPVLIAIARSRRVAGL
jgi:iron complex transport system permease protein